MNARMTLQVNAVGLIKVKVELPKDVVVMTKKVTLTPDVSITGVQ